MSKFTNFISNIRQRLRIRTGSASSFAARFANKNSLMDALRSPEIRKKILFTLSMVVLYRLLASITIPGIDVELFRQTFGDNPLNNIYTIVTGGRLDSPSIVALGLGAYINASIILQLLTTVIPKLEELSKEGERGRQVINQYTRFLAVPLGVMQAFAIYLFIKSTPQLASLLESLTRFDVLVLIITLTAGTIILMWLGELISEYGIGNGVSIIITVGILSSLPGLISRDFAFFSVDLELLLRGNFSILFNEQMLFLYGTIVGFFILILGTVYITEAVRKIPIQYARRVRGGQGQNNYLPLKITQAGVIPVIFASSVLTFPQIIAQLLQSLSNPDSIFYKIGQKIADSFLGSNNVLTGGRNFVYYELCYFALIVIFTFFYTFITYKPSETAENLQKSGGFIPGLRPGKATEKFIQFILIRLTVLGAVFLAVIAVIPNIVRLTSYGQNLTLLSGIGGTSLLIIIGVVLDTIRQMRSITVTRSYEKYK